ncbi:rhodanese-like domain-containing protein [Citricoccus zhacaiensis]|uniref:rhodanese-like domain-containing protein n=1 Tax=Citricoccus zhacaiensis TaxID=489142 RepID=UPI000255EFEB|nr:rhodanese-like domain-containing protein [Citricoccus sp. CH26A]
MKEVGSEAALRNAHCELDGLTPKQALAEQANGALLIDVRLEAHSAGIAGIPGAIVIDLMLLSLRLDPTSEHRIPEADSWDSRYVLFCEHGQSSQLAASELRKRGLHRATHMTGGFEAWAGAGLTTVHGSADVRS